jgi:hypothetical protein
MSENQRPRPAPAVTPTTESESSTSESPATSSGGGSQIQFKTGGAMPPVGGGFQSLAPSPTDAAYNEPVQFKKETDDEPKSLGQSKIDAEVENSQGMNASLMLAAKHIYDASDQMRAAMAMNTTGPANSGPAVNMIDKAYAAVGEKGGEVARISASLTRSGARNISLVKDGIKAVNRAILIFTDAAQDAESWGKGLNPALSLKYDVSDLVRAQRELHSHFDIEFSGPNSLGRGNVAPGSTDELQKKAVVENFQAAIAAAETLQLGLAAKEPSTRLQKYRGLVSIAITEINDLLETDKKPKSYLPQLKALNQELGQVRDAAAGDRDFENWINITSNQLRMMANKIRG